MCEPGAGTPKCNVLLQNHTHRNAVWLVKSRHTQMQCITAEPHTHCNANPEGQDSPHHTKPTGQPTKRWKSNKEMSKKRNPPHHTKPRGQDPGHQMQQHPLWNANCGHQTLCFPLRTHQNEAKSNKDITKSCSPHTKQSKQDKIQATQC